MNRSDVDALAETWMSGKDGRESVIKALSVLDGPFAALAGAYLYHEMPDDWNRGIFARMLQATCEKTPAKLAEMNCLACGGRGYRVKWNNGRGRTTNCKTCRGTGKRAS